MTGIICKRVNNQILTMRYHSKPNRQHKHISPIPNQEHPLNHPQQKSNVDPMKKLINAFNEVEHNKEWMV